MNDKDIPIVTPVRGVSGDRLRSLEKENKRLLKENLALKKFDAFLKAKLEEDNR